MVLGGYTVIHWTPLVMTTLRLDHFGKNIRMVTITETAMSVSYNHTKIDTVRHKMTKNIHVIKNFVSIKQTHGDMLL